MSDREGNLGEGLQAIGRGASIDDSGSAVPLNKNPPGMPSVVTKTAGEYANTPDGSGYAVRHPHGLRRDMYPLPPGPDPPLCGMQTRQLDLRAARDQRNGPYQSTPLC